MTPADLDDARATGARIAKLLRFLADAFEQGNARGAFSLVRDSDYPVDTGPPASGIILRVAERAAGYTWKIDCQSFGEMPAGIYPPEPAGPPEVGHLAPWIPGPADRGNR